MFFHDGSDRSATVWHYIVTISVWVVENLPAQHKWRWVSNSTGQHSPSHHLGSFPERHTYTILSTWLLLGPLLVLSEQSPDWKRVTQHYSCVSVTFMCTNTLEQTSDKVLVYTKHGKWIMSLFIKCWRLNGCTVHVQYVRREGWVQSVCRPGRQWPQSTLKLILLFPLCLNI